MIESGLSHRDFIVTQQSIAIFTQATIQDVRNFGVESNGEIAMIGNTNYESVKSNGVKTSILLRHEFRTRKDHHRRRSPNHTQIVVEILTSA